MSQIQWLRVFLNQRLIAAADEIFGVVEQTITDYQEECSRTKEENDRLQKLLDIVIKPEVKVHRTDLQKVTASEEEVPPEHHHCEQNWSPIFGQEDPEVTLIKKEPEELRSSQREEQLYWLEEDFPLSPGLVKNDSDHGQSQSPHLYYPQCVRNAPCNTTEQSNTDNDEEEYRVLEPNCNSQLPVAGNSQYFESQTENGDPRDEGGLRQERNETRKVKRSRICTKNEMRYMELSHVKSQMGGCQSPAALPLCFCKVCRKPLGSMFSLASHMKLHRMDDKQSFDSTESIQEHLQTNNTGFSCHVCHEHFHLTTELIMHMRIHEGEKPFKCQNCGKGFNNSSNMIKHIRSHTGEKPYKCPHCGKGFSNSSNMKVHIRIHTGEKPYACHICGKGFIQKAKKEVHMMIHTGEKPHSCSVCGKCFRHVPDMRVHMRSHTGEKPYVCPVCSKSFISSSGLCAHQKSHSENSVE